MLRIYTVALHLCRDAATAARSIARHDNDLARQLRRAAASVPLNLAEGSGVRAGNRRLRYQTALGSALEVRACFDVAGAFGYIGAVGDGVDARLDHIVGVLMKVTR